MEWQKMLVRFKAEIAFSAQPLPELIENCGEYVYCREALRQREFAENPLLAMKEAGRKILVNEKDRGLYENFIAGFGTSHTQSQVEHIELYESLVHTHCQEARGEREQKARLYVALGAFGAVTLCMLVI